MTDISKIQEFIDSHVNKVKTLSKEANQTYYNAITTGNKEFYDKYEKLALQIEKIYHNKKDFEKVKSFYNQEITDPSIKRQIKILYHGYLGSQGDIKLIKKIIKLSSKIEKKFNTYRAKIKGKAHTDNEIKDILKKETNSKILEKAWSSSKKQATVVVKDLLVLIKLRNELAKSLGFPNYYVMSLQLSDQDEKVIKNLYEELDELTKAPFENLKLDIDSILKEKYKVDILKPWHYNDLFFQEAPTIYKIDLDKYYKNQDVLKIAQDFYKNLDLPIDDVLEKSDLYEKENKYQHACCMDIDREGDVRIVQSVKNNEHWMDTTLHELGHAAYDKYINKQLPYILRDAAHIFTTEAIALLFGRFSTNPDLIEHYCNISLDEKKEISETLSKIIKLQKLVFSRWSQVMVNFERNLYENPDQDLNKLWWDLVKKYQLIDFYRDSPDWASKIHIASSPVYYHNYLLGDLLSSQLKNYINKNILEDEKSSWLNNKKVGNYLKDKVFSVGKYYEWNEMIAKATNEPLTPKYFAIEFC
ncbi:MAG: M2 family metallopeptidase [Candidatus Pacearchaeota archaeon]|jgi:peptidyl-dipeptidase A